MSTDQQADEVFGLLSDEIRIEILREVAIAGDEIEGAGTGPSELSFSEIYNRVAVDNSSKLSYHLGELAGMFLRKGDDGYSLTHAGERIVRFILSGNYQQPPEFGPEPIDGTCVFCGEERLEAGLYHQFLRIDCRGCGEQVMGQPITPAQVREREVDDILDSAKQKSARDARQVRQGVCPKCSGQLATEILDLREGPLPDADSFLVRSRCQDCLREYNMPLTYALAYHPASVAFHWDHGVDVTDSGVWEFHGPVRNGLWTSERVSTDQDEYEVVFRRDGDALHLRVESDLTVGRTERVRRDRSGDHGL